MQAVVRQALGERQRGIHGRIVQMRDVFGEIPVTDSMDNPYLAVFISRKHHAFVLFARVFHADARPAPGVQRLMLVTTAKCARSSKMNCPNTIKAVTGLRPGEFRAKRRPWRIRKNGTPHISLARRRISPLYIPTSIAFRSTPSAHPGFSQSAQLARLRPTLLWIALIQEERGASLEKKSCASPQTSTAHVDWQCRHLENERTTSASAKPCFRSTGPHLTLDPALERPLAKLSAGEFLSAHSDPAPP